MQGFFDAASLTVRSSPSLLPRCGLCRLFEGCRSPKMPVSGKGRRKILIVGEAPGETENSRGIQFCGKTGGMLDAALRSLGVDMRLDCWLTNALICWPGKGNKIPDLKMVDYCRPNLVNTIKELKPELILLLGAVAVKSLITWLWKDDPGGINRWAGYRIPCQRLNAWVCPMWHPSFLIPRKDPTGDGIKIEQAQLATLVWERHLKAAVGLADSRPWKTVPDYSSGVEIELNPNAAAKKIREIRRSGKLVAWDMENDRLKPDHKNAKIYCCSISDGKTSLAFPWHGETIVAMREFIRSPQPKIAYNAKHEDRWCLKEFGVQCRNWVWDGMLNAHCLDNRAGTKSLKFQAFVLLGQEDYDSAVKPYLKADGANVPNRIKEAGLETILKYNAMDSILEYHVAKKQAKQLGIEL